MNRPSGGGPSSLNTVTNSLLAVISVPVFGRACSRIVHAAENLLGPDGKAPLKPDDDPDSGSGNGGASSTPPSSPPPPAALKAARPARRRQ